MSENFLAELLELFYCSHCNSGTNIQTFVKKTTDCNTFFQKNYLLLYNALLLRL